MRRLTFIAVALLAIVGRASAQNSIVCADVTARSGQEVELPIVLTNDAALTIVGISFTLELPDGVTVKEEEEEPVYTLVSSRLNPKRFTVYSAKYENGSWGFRISTNGTGVLSGTEGEFMTITLNIGNMEDGDYFVTLVDNKLSVKESDNSVKSVDISNSISTLTISNAPVSITLDENASEEIVAGTYEEVFLKRAFTAGWNTVCVPFAIDDVEAFFGTGAKAYEFEGFENGELSFSAVEELEATLPYVVYVPEAITDMTLTNITIEDDDTEAGVFSFNKKYYFRGTYAPVAAGEWTKKADTDDIYGVTPDGHVAKAGAEASIKGFRAYFDMPAGAAVKALVFLDDATGIRSIDNESGNEIYNLAGQRMNKMQKGVNITNGKKILK